MKTIITAKNEGTTKLYYAGYGKELTDKGLESGALAGANRVPNFVSNIENAQIIETYIDTN